MAYLLIRKRRIFGVASLSFIDCPLTLGGTLQGVIKVPKRLERIKGIEIRLLCLRSFRRKTISSDEWFPRKFVSADKINFLEDSTVIPVNLQIPDALPPGENSLRRGRIQWRLEVKTTPNKRPYFHASFPLQVANDPEQKRPAAHAAHTREN